MDVFGRLERFYDAVPRDRARAEELGGFVLFVAETAGHPFYARPRLGMTPSAADLARARERQQELGLPEAFEWVDETTPGLLPLVSAAGLPVLEAPLMVLDPSRLPPEVVDGVHVMAPTPDSLALGDAIARAGFGDGAFEVKPWEPSSVVAAAARVAAGSMCHVLAGEVAVGSYQRVGPVAELVGIATLPAWRRRGLGGAVTGVLARHALDAGCDLVFLSAGSEDTARVYARLGFRRVGTACIAE